MLTCHALFRFRERGDTSSYRGRDLLITGALRRARNQWPWVDRFAETHGDSVRSREFPRDWPGGITALDINRNDRHRMLLYQRANARQKALQLTIGTPATLGKPDEVPAALKRKSAHR